MSFWILIYNDIKGPRYTGPVGLYKTRDEAIEASIIRFYENGLRGAHGGKGWFLSDGPIGFHIQLKGMRKRVKKNNFLDTENIWNNDLCKCKRYYTIVEMKVTKIRKWSR